MWIRYPSPENLAYIAGFFDGEGTVAISKPEGTSHYLLRCSIINTDREPLDYVHSFFGGSVIGPYTREDNHKPVFHWKCDAIKAEVFLRSIGPYLKTKHERAILGLEFRELFQGEFVLPRGREKQHMHNQEKRKAIIDLRHDYYLRMKKLNQRGVTHD